MIYIFLFLLLFFFSFTKKYNNFFFHLAVLILLFIGCFRGQTIGTDTRGGYKTIYDYVMSGIDVSGYEEIGWVLLNKLAKLFDFDYQFILISSELLCVLPVCYVILKTVKNKCFGLYIYYCSYLYLHSFNMIRQCIAMSFCILSLYCLFHKKKIVLSILSFFIAYCFHKSSIVFLMVYIVCFIRISTIESIILCISTYLVGIVLSSSFFSFFLGRYSGYLDNSDYGFRSSPIVSMILALVVTILFVFYLLLNKGKMRKNIYYKTTLLGILCMNITQRLVLGTRLVYYFSQAQCVYYPKYFEMKRKDKGILLFIISLYYFFIFIKILIGQWGEINPYYLCFN